MPNADFKTYIVDDQPTDKDALDFTPYVETLADIIQTGNTPLTIGVFGGWGSGKTSLMKMVKNQLPNGFTVAWFDAWKYDKEETLWRAFLLNVLFAVEQKSGETEELKTLKTMLYRGLEFEKTGGVTIDLAKLGAKIAEGAIQIGLSFIPPLATLADMAKELQKSGAGNVAGGFESAIQRERTKIYVEQVRSLEQFQEKFATLIKSYISPQRLVVFVDDLDRCLPEKAIQVLEAIKLFLDVENCVFILGLDQEIIARGIEMKYRDLGEKQKSNNQRNFTIEGMRYLEKIIQLPFQIPPVEQNEMGRFVKKLSADWPDEECPKVFIEGLGDNPRQIKRTVNTFLMLWNLAQKRRIKLGDQIEPTRLAKVVVIQAVFPELYNILKETPRLLRELEEYYFKELNASLSSVPNELLDVVILGEEFDDDQILEFASKETLPKISPLLSPFISLRSLRRILTMHGPNQIRTNFQGLKPKEIQLYFTITRGIETSQTISATATSYLVIKPQLINIPAGKFLMGASAQEILMSANADRNNSKWTKWEEPQHEVTLSEYFIGKFPVTNIEYQAFIKDEKYYPPSDWDGEIIPKGKSDHPVVNVSFSDAMAYCKWLSKKSGKKYRLPSEAEWEKAARGNNGNIWPWGNEFKENYANTLELKIDTTTSVGQFSPEGDSFYGCVDMIGNIWEWTSSLWGDDWDKPTYHYPYNLKDGRENIIPTSKELHVLRGGSFNQEKWINRCAFRNRDLPNDSSRYIGFRIALSQSEPI